MPFFRDLTVLIGDGNSAVCLRLHSPAVYTRAALTILVCWQAMLVGRIPRVAVCLGSGEALVCDKLTDQTLVLIVLLLELLHKPQGRVGSVDQRLLLRLFGDRQSVLKSVDFFSFLIFLLWRELVLIWRQIRSLIGRLFRGQQVLLEIEERLPQADCWSSLVDLQFVRLGVGRRGRLGACCGHCTVGELSNCRVIYTGESAGQSLRGIGIAAFLGRSNSLLWRVFLDRKAGRALTIWLLRRGRRPHH